MKFGEIVKICSAPLVTVAKKYGKEIDPSFVSNTLSYILYNYSVHTIDDYSITTRNNPVNLYDPSTGKQREFSTLEECFIQFKESEYDDIDFSKHEEAKKYVKSFNLYRFDKEVLGSIGDNIVDLKEEDRQPVVDVYKVEKRDKVVSQTNNLEEAKKIKENNSGSVIKNSRNEIVGEKVKYNSSKICGTRYEAGTKVICNGINLYAKFRDTTPSRSITGEYYMWDGKIVDGRVALCKKPEFTGEVAKVVGFVRAMDLTK